MIRYGWVRDLPDQRDVAFSVPKIFFDDLPERADLREEFGQLPVLNQGSLGSCVWNAMSSANQFAQKRAKQEEWVGSRLFGYYNTRAMIGTTNVDSGSSIRDGFKSINRQGIVPEVEWPYDIMAFRTRPLQECYDHGKKHQGVLYSRVPQTLLHLKAAIAVRQYPVVFGIMVYESFESDVVRKTGRVPLPKRSEAALGGHAVLMIGYDNSEKSFICQNSWGEEWGDKGFFYLPYRYATRVNLASDFWTLERVEGGK